MSTGKIMKVIKAALFIFKIIFATVITLFATVIILFIIFPILNDMKAERLAMELQNKISLPNKTEIVEVLSGCGNTSGTGNQVRIWLGILIKTELNDKDIFEYFGNSDVQKVTSYERETLSMCNLSKKFSRLIHESELDGYYIVEWIADPVSSFFDLRGH